MGLPVELQVTGRDALVIGSGGEIAAKVERLLTEGARVTVVTEQPDGAVEELAVRGVIRLARRPFTEDDLEGKFVTFLAPGDDDLAARMCERARSRGELFCAIDRPELCTFTSAAVVYAGGLRVAVSSSGASPGIVRRLREDLEALLGDARLARFVDVLRAERARLPRGSRARALAAAVRGFALAGTLRFPPWFERGEPPPPA